MKALLLSLALLALAPGAVAAPAAAAPVPGPAMPVAAAREVDARLPSMRTLDRLVEGVSPEGASVTAYRSARGLEKIEVVALGERGRVLQDFYWHGGTLIAARERRIDYGGDITALPTDQPLPMRLVQDDAVAWHGGQLQQWVRDEAPQQAPGREAAAVASRLAAAARSYRRLAMTREPARDASCTWRCAGDWTAECRAFVCR